MNSENYMNNENIQTGFEVGFELQINMWKKETSKRSKKNSNLVVYHNIIPVCTREMISVFKDIETEISAII